LAVCCQSVQIAKMYVRVELKHVSERSTTDETVRKTSRDALASLRHKLTTSHNNSDAAAAALSSSSSTSPSARVYRLHAWF